MTQDEKVAYIRSKCVEANPDIIINKYAQLIKQDHSVEYFEQCRPIRLADVLLTLNQVNTTFHLTFHGEFFSDLKREYTDIFWNLRKDDLTQQSPECIDFLAKLLTNK